MEEAFYLLEGELTVRIGERTVKATAGSFVLVPRGTVHTFSNPGTRPARMLGIFSPGGFEQYFEELPEIVATYGYPPPLDIMMSLERKYNMEAVAPPQGG